MDAPLDLSTEDSSGSILLSQYRDLYGSRPWGGERRLLWAVLEEAIRSYLVNTKRHTPKQRKEFSEVNRWFRSTDPKQGLFSFPSICELLNIEANMLLKGLRTTSVSNLPKRRDRSIGRAATLRNFAT